MSRALMVFSSLLLCTQAHAFNPATSETCQSTTQLLLSSARETDKKNVFRISLVKGDQRQGSRVRAFGKKMSLRQAILRAPAGSTLLLAKGVYQLAESGAKTGYTGLLIKQNNLSLIGDSPNPADVVIDANYRNLGDSSGNLSVSGADVTLANLTVKRSIFHLIHLWQGADRITVHNVHLIDGGQQFLKTSPGGGQLLGGKVTCSQFLMSDAGRDNVWGYGKPDGWTSCYTGGIDAHDTHDWLVSDNRFEGIYCNSGGVARPAHQRKASLRDKQTYKGGLAEHAIHFWDSKKGTAHTIKNNQIINCARGIGIGLKKPVFGGLVMNNMITSVYAGSREHDVGIAIYHAAGVKVLNNSIFFSHARAYPHAIEIINRNSKAPEVDNQVVNNLVNQMIRLRNGGRARLDKNVLTANDEWFVNPLKGDLHLKACPRVPMVIANGVTVNDVTDDIDGDLRSAIMNIGADQCAE